MNVWSKRLKANKFGCLVVVIEIVEYIFGPKHVMEWSGVWIWQRRIYILVWIGVHVDVMVMALQKLIK